MKKKHRLTCRDVSLINLFLDFIHFCRLTKKLSQNRNHVRSTLFLVTRGLLWPDKEVFWDHNPNSENKKTYLLIFEYCKTPVLSTSGSKTHNFGILEFSPLPIIDTGYSCAEKTILEARCSPIYNFILMLTWTESDINAPICLLSGLRVRITADRKDRYTLLPKFPFLIILKLKMAVFLKVSFRSFNIYIRFALHTDSGFLRTRKKGNVSETDIQKLFHFQKVQSACTQNIKLHVCVGVACNSSKTSVFVDTLKIYPATKLCIYNIMYIQKYLFICMYICINMYTHTHIYIFKSRNCLVEKLLQICFLL